MQTWGGIAGRCETEIVLSQNALAEVSRFNPRVGDSCQEKSPGIMPKSSENRSQ